MAESGFTLTQISMEPPKRHEDYLPFKSGLRGVAFVVGRGYLFGLGLGGLRPIETTIILPHITPPKGV